VNSRRGNKARDYKAFMDCHDAICVRSLRRGAITILLARRGDHIPVGGASFLNKTARRF
jgi:hypothetical protein